MSEIQVLLVAGTHGNEINPIWLFEQWEKLAVLINTYGIATHKVIGNPKAYKAGKIQHDQMTIIAGMLSEQDIENVAEWYSRVKIKIFDPNLVLSKPSN